MTNEEATPDPECHTKYKTVDKKIRPVAAQVDETHAQPVRRPPFDPPIEYTPVDWDVPIWNLPRKASKRITDDRLATIDFGPEGFLNAEEKETLIKATLHFDLAFSFDRSEKGMIKPEYFDQYIIKTVPHDPWVSHTIPPPKARREEAIAIYDEQLKDGDLEYCDGPYVNPSFFVEKKDKTLRKVVDLGALNAVTVRDANVPPNIVEFTESLAGHVCYGSADMHSFFDQIALHPASRPMTAIRTPKGLLQHTRLPMGFTNSPAVAQRISTSIFADEMPMFADVFVDDTIIKGPRTDYNNELHPGTNMRKWFVEYLRTFCRCLRRYIHSGLTISGVKFIAIAPRLAMTGVIIDKKGRHADPKKVAKLENWACPPPNVSSLRGFLGLANYLRYFIQNFSTIDAPLRKLTTGRFRWNEDATKAMRKIQEAAKRKSICSEIDQTNKEPLILAVDSSVIAVGWALFQKDDNAHDGRRLIHYGSIGFNEVEGRYVESKFGQSKLELYGVYRAVRKSKLYLYGHRTIIEVDCIALKNMVNSPDLPNHPMNRWISYIQHFDVEFVHVPGKQHVIPDGLSRTDFGLEPEEDEWPETKIDLGTRRPTAEEEDWIARGGKRVRFSEDGDDSEDDNTSLFDDSLGDSDDPDEADTFAEVNAHALERTEGTEPAEESLSDASDEEPVQDAIFQADSNRSENADPDFDDTKYSGKWRQMGVYLLHGLQHKTIADIAPSRRNWLKKHSNEYFLDQGRLYRRMKNELPVLVIDTKEEKDRLLWETHEHETLHRGRDAGIALLSKRVWWERMRVDYSDHVQSCDTCQRRRQVSQREEFRGAPIPGLFQQFSMDIVDLGSGVGPNRYIVIARCELTSWPEARIIPDKSAASVRTFLLEDVITRYGSTIQVIKTDNGTENKGETAWIIQHLGYKHAHSTPYNPEGNATVERGHSTIVEGMLRASADDRLRTHTYLPAALWADRITTKRSTGYSPYELVYGLSPELPMDRDFKTFVAYDWDRVQTTEELIATRTRQLKRRVDDLERAAERLAYTRGQSRAHMNEKEGHLIRDSLQPDAMVLVHVPVHTHRAQDRWRGPYRITQQMPGGSYRLKELDGTPCATLVAAKDLRLYYPRGDFPLAARPQPIADTLPASIPTHPHPRQRSPPPQPSAMATAPVPFRLPVARMSRPALPHADMAPSRSQPPIPATNHPPSYPSSAPSPTRSPTMSHLWPALPSLPTQPPSQPYQPSFAPYQYPRPLPLPPYPGAYSTPTWNPVPPAPSGPPLHVRSPPAPSVLPYPSTAAYPYYFRPAPPNLLRPDLVDTAADDPAAPTHRMPNTPFADGRWEHSSQVGLG